MMGSGTFGIKSFGIKTAAGGSVHVAWNINGVLELHRDMCQNALVDCVK